MRVPESLHIEEALQVVQTDCTLDLQRGAPLCQVIALLKQLQARLTLGTNPAGSGTIGGVPVMLLLLCHGSAVAVVRSS